MKIKVVLPVSQIDNGSRVQKKEGDFWYILRRQINIVDQVIVAGKGTAFLVQPDGNIGTIAGTEEMVVEMDMDELENFLGEQGYYD